MDKSDKKIDHSGSNNVSHNFNSDTHKELIRNNSRPVVLLFDSDGLSNYTCYLARGISKFRKVVLYGFSEDSYIVTGASLEKTIKFHYVKKWLPKGYSTLRGITRVFLLFFILFVTLTRTKYNIVHIQEHLPMFFFFIPLLKLRRKKIFWTLHDTEIFSPSKNIHGKLQVLFLKIVSQPNMMIKYSDAIMVHALSLKEQLINKKVDKNKMHVIPHFDYNYLREISSDNLTNFINNSNSCQNQNLLPKEYALFFGNIAPWKGIEVLIDAAKIVSNQIGDKFNLVIAGTPYEGYQSYFYNLIKEDHNHIHIVNRYIKSYEILSIIKDSRFLVLPYTENFQHSVSGVIPLAYTFSKPVIVSNLGTLSEYVENRKTGLIFESGNSEQLANCIMELIKNRDLCREMGQKANQKLLKEMSLELYCDRLNELYNNE
jgi:alpha-maltose-1-phosphate synthase